MVLQDDPDTIEDTFPAMKLSNVLVDALTVTGDLTYENLTTEPYPARIYSPAEFPGLIR